MLTCNVDDPVSLIEVPENDSIHTFPVFAIEFRDAIFAANHAGNGHVTESRTVRLQQMVQYGATDISCRA